jgi:hypothetical protein
LPERLQSAAAVAAGDCMNGVAGWKVINNLVQLFMLWVKFGSIQAKFK